MNILGLNTVRTSIGFLTFRMSNMNPCFLLVRFYGKLHERAAGDFLDDTQIRMKHS